jgi:hypothetical protein
MSQSGAKKKGRTPAHQNKFAFRHNPKSKKTDAILSLPNTHVCRRCHEKIEWRKQYRKYKSRTVVGKCNACQLKKVQAAYHTICELCTRESAKAKELLASWEDEEHVRVCAICVKEAALPDANEAGLDDNITAATRRLKLRERKTLERQQERALNPKRKDERECADEEGSNEIVEDDGLETDEDGLSGSDADDDPFLKAVGGADKLLTGDAYRNMLLQKAEQHQNIQAETGSS